MSESKYTVKCLDDSHAALLATVLNNAPKQIKATRKYHNEIDDDSTANRQQQITNALEMLHQLAPALQAILDAELKAGNKVADVSQGYPDEKSICVTLSKRFKNAYKTSNVIYKKCNDPHYWYADYCTVSTPKHLIICG